MAILKFHVTTFDKLEASSIYSMRISNISVHALLFVWMNLCPFGMR